MAGRCHDRLGAGILPSLPTPGRKLVSVAYVLEVKTAGDVIVFEPHGHVDAEAARHLLEMAEAAAGEAPAVEVHLDAVSSLTEEGAALLLFRWSPGRRLPPGVTLRATGQPGRQAVLRAYAGRRSPAPGTD